MKFADFKEGDVYELGPVLVDQEESIAFAERYDSQWFHVDPVLAQEGQWDGLIVSGWFTCALAMRLISRDILADSDCYASPGLSYLKWLHPVRPGDQLRLKVKVIEARVSASKQWLGVVRYQWTLRNQHEIDVLDLEAMTLFKLD